MKGLMLPQMRKALGEGLPVPALTAVIDGKAVGAIAGAAAGMGVFEIHSLYVAPEYRRQGAGRALIDSIAELTDSMGLGLKAEYTLQDEDNKTLEPFFVANDFVDDPVEYPMYCLGRLENLSINVRGSQRMYKGIQPFLETPGRMLEAATLRSFKTGWPLPEGGLMSDKTDREMSYCVSDGDKIRAYVAVEPMAYEMVRISALWSELNDPREMMVMLSRTLERMKQRYKGRTRVAMLALNSMSYRIIEHVCGEVELCSYRYIRKD